ncbi:hypothetical protein D3C84_662380 [compost metagenome]
MVDAHRWSGNHFWATDAFEKFRQLPQVHGLAGIQQDATGLQMVNRQGEFTDRQRPVEYFHRAIDAADQPGRQPQVRLQRQVRLIDQQQRRGAQLTIVMVDACAEFAAEPGTKKRALHLLTELALPALLQNDQQGHQQLFT